MFPKLDEFIERALHYAHVRKSYGPRCHYPLDGCYTCEAWLEYDQTWDSEHHDDMKLPDADAYEKPKT